MSHNDARMGGLQMAHILKKGAPDFKPLLELPNPFCVWDIEDSPIDMGGDTYQQLLARLKRAGAVAQVDTRVEIKPVERNDRPGTTTRYEANVYQWNPRAKKILREAVDHDETLPCGHRVHIRNHGDGTFGCRYCNQERHYDRETIENRL